jgi:hypothetical protein
MKRKLISFDVFKKIEEQSLANTQNELIEAQEVLAEALGLEDLKLFTFSESDVTYETPDGTFIHATYVIKDDKVILENIEQLVIDEESEKNGTRQIISNMIDSIIDGDEIKATNQFEQYIDAPNTKRSLSEAVFSVTASKPTGKRSKLYHRKRNKAAVRKGVISRLRTLKSLSPSKKASLKRERNRTAKKLGSRGSSTRARVYVRKVKSSLKEWTNLCENVLGYLNFREFGPVINESFFKHDKTGDLTGIAFPTLQKRNEGKVLSLNYDVLDTEVKLVRGKMKNLKEDQNFVKAMAELKRYNNISDNNGLETTLEAIAKFWPDVLYVTEGELAAHISAALESANVKNYDDQICAFMAEAILRTAHNAYTDRVKKIGVLAGSEKDLTSECKECEDAYNDFKTVAEQFYARVDESEDRELQVFADLYKALRKVHELAVEADDAEIANEAAELITQCASILNGEEPADFELAETVAEYLASIIEANVEGASEDWDVVTTPHHTVVGDHPVLAKKAKVDGVPSMHPGDWKSPAPVSDGKSYSGNLDDEMRSDCWSNVGGNDTWPTLDNPYVPKADTFKMKEKSVVDDGDELSQNQSNDTWPNLKNPYSPDAEGGNHMPGDVK